MGIIKREIKPAKVTYAALVVERPDTSLLTGEVRINGRITVSRRFSSLLIPFYSDNSQTVFDVLQSYENPSCSQSYLRLKQKGENLSSNRRLFLEGIIEKLAQEIKECLKGSQPVKKLLPDGRAWVKFNNMYSKELCKLFYKEDSVGYSFRGQLKINPEDIGLPKEYYVKNRPIVIWSTPMRD